MKEVYLATDHAGFNLKERVKHVLTEQGYPVKDCGAHEYDPSDDYPDYIKIAAKAISDNPENKAIIFGSSGQGEAIVANKFRGVRAVVFYSPAVPSGAVDVSGRTSSDPFEMIRLTREHNDANVLSIGANILNEKDALTAIEQWLQTPFTGEERHTRRINKIKEIETDRKED